jgi:flavin-dependent dehydrogenase
MRAPIDKAVILGAGMGGLFSALALAPHCRRVVVLERDPAPPATPAEAFTTWRRRGAPQLRHTHAFRARMTQLLRREQPGLMTELEALGVQQQDLRDTLPGGPGAQDAAGNDDDLSVILSRRASFELALHRQLARFPNVDLCTGVNVTGLLARRDPAGRLVAEGFATSGGEVRGDIVVDAGGRGSPVAEWVEALGGALAESGARAGIVYYTQFYQLRPGAAAPERPAVGDLGYLKYGAIPADNGAYSITLAIPEDDLAMRQAAVHPKRFAQMVGAIPAAAAWARPEIAEPVGRPAGMGDLKSRWRDMAPAGRPAALNLFLVGDSLVLSNPLHGRGCTFAAVEAHLLRDALLANAEPAARARTYDRAVRRALKAYYRDMQRLDREAVEAAAQHLGGAPAPGGWWAGLAARYRREGLGGAVRRHRAVARRQLRAHQLLDPPGRWRADPRTVAAALAGLASAPRGVPAPPGPTRAAMLQAAAAPEGL